MVEQMAHLGSLRGRKVLQNLPYTERSMSAFRNRLVALQDEIRNTGGIVLVGGDFHARALEWDMPLPNS